MTSQTRTLLVTTNWRVIRGGKQPMRVAPKVERAGVDALIGRLIIFGFLGAFWYGVYCLACRLIGGGR